jgi:hypothetical protein
MNLFVQIPCLNESESLETVIRSIPRTIPGVSEVHIVVVDDGSTDSTSEVARCGRNYQASPDSWFSGGLSIWHGLRHYPWRRHHRQH